jgi:hypothetical protein
MKKIKKISLNDLSKKEIGKPIQSEIKGGDSCPWANCQCNTVSWFTTDQAIQVRLSMYGLP